MGKIGKPGSKTLILICLFNENLGIDVPIRGEVRSYHVYLLTVANYGCIEVLSDSEMRSKMQRETLLSGRPPAKFKEIDDAIRKAR